MTAGGRSKLAVLGLWAATAALLTAAALAGNLLLGGASDSALGLIRSFAGGAVVGSLAIEVFPKAFKESGYSTGIAVALGLLLCLPSTGWDNHLPRQARAHTATQGM